MTYFLVIEKVWTPHNGEVLLSQNPRRTFLKLQSNKDLTSIHLKIIWPPIKSFALQIEKKEIGFNFINVLHAAFAPTVVRQ
jgi:hypothetical protein